MTDTVLSAYAGDLTQMLSTLSGMSARPAFNLAFANIQNSYANQYNDKMQVLQRKAMDTYDTSLDTELSKLKEQLPKLQDYQNLVSNAVAQVAETLDKIGDLDLQNASLQLHAAAGDTPDATEYNASVDSLNESLSRLPNVDGTEFSFYGDEGVGDIRLNGIGIKHFSADDDQAKPPTGSSVELAAGLTRANQLVSQLYNRLDMAAGEVTRVQDRISEIEDHQQTQAADIKKDVAKQAKQMKLEIASQLQALSVSFESQQQQNEKIVKAQTNDTYQPGSVVNLFS
ncbi:hypothetical protein CCC_00282 [Paramagnetospirillum magnetotacticum MS-1]|uniref:Uncharacterized protein n=1 Tax=Paramagnetospirillum magnetotacticum MS-1 TaxID=272627 RepID=A0A0C2UWN3_PARME|nr:hypothetical protein [Paramagnetospirillum magnetotacticum]KIL97221.1 hypothetical protein CCC_00282 [Paramagnetospirillum magnetotacticum MS-1]